MDDKNANKNIGLYLQGEFKLVGNQLSSFIGPVKKGLRLVLWGNTDKRATSCVFIKDINIKIGEAAEGEIVILSPQSIDKEIVVGETYCIGNPGIMLGQFKIEKLLGNWTGKIPSALI